MVVDLDGELHSHGYAPAKGEKETAYEFDRLVADSDCPRDCDVHGSAQPSNPELAGGSFYDRGHRSLGLAS